VQADMALFTFTPLGGAGEIGMNMYLYGYGPRTKQRYIVVDVGVTFANMESSPGIGIILPNLETLVRLESQIEAIFLTHGHQDHVGAIGHAAAMLKVPIYAQPFSRRIAGARLVDKGIAIDRITPCGKWPETITAGPFEVGYLPISHSTPESAGLVIETPSGRAIHSGDFKLDPDPVVGDPYDPTLWDAVARDGIVALMCDSTNATIEGGSRSESSLSDNLESLFRRSSGMIVATTFASHVARLNQLARTAAACNRSVALTGRAMEMTVSAAVETGIIEPFPNLVTVKQAKDMPREEICLLATGSQGEPRSAVSMLSSGRSYRGLKIMPGDTVLYSSRTIPGNELSVGRVLNNLARRGAHVYDDSVRHYHVSGHPDQEDLVAMHKVVKPDMVVPIHGEVRHLMAHAELARAHGHRAMVVENGTTIDILKRRAIEADLPTGRIHIDGKINAGLENDFIRDRLRMAQEGHVAVSIATRNGKVTRNGVMVLATGLPTPAQDAIGEDIRARLRSHLDSLSRRVMADDADLEDEILKEIVPALTNTVGKRPKVTVAIHRT